MKLLFYHDDIQGLENTIIEFLNTLAE